MTSRNPAGEAAPVNAAATAAEHHGVLPDLVQHPAPAVELSTSADACLSIVCPLCGGAECREVCRDPGRVYWHCSTCCLTFVSSSSFLPPAAELAVYQQHQNRIDDPQYRRFLSRLFEPLQARLTTPGCGLDFGCGPGPALAAMLREAGHHMEVFDPYFANDPTVFTRTYDFITSSEVFEHLQAPRWELQRLWSCLRPGGLLGVMTKRLPDPSQLASWYYRLDPTHVVFFSDATFGWIARWLSAELTVVNVDVVLLQKLSL